MNAGLVLTMSVFLVFGLFGIIYACIVRLASFAAQEPASKVMPE